MKTLPKLKLKKIIITAIILSVFAIVGAVKAQELERTFTLINPQIQQQLNPGEKAEGTTKIINETNVPLTFNTGVQDFTVADNLGTPSILPPNTLNNKYSAAAWIGVTPSTFTVLPGHSQVINYFIQTPFNAAPGGHYAAIVYEPTVSKTNNASGGQVNTQIGSLFYITVKGPVKESANVSRFSANSFSEYGPVKITTEIKNMGDLHISPKATITVTGLLFKKTQDLALHNIFPQTARDFENSIGSTFMVGRYKAEFLGSYGVNNNLPLVATLYFWVFPWKLTIVIILLIVAAVLGTKYYKKQKKDHHKGSDKPTEEPKKEDSKIAQEAQNPETA